MNIYVSDYNADVSLTVFPRMQNNQVFSAKLDYI